MFLFLLIILIKYINRVYVFEIDINKINKDLNIVL
jgi:hypothetical protein